MRTISIDGKLKAYGIVGTDGTILYLSMDSDDVWNHFFQERAHRFPIYEAIKAYEAIGYRMQEFDLVPSKMSESHRKIEVVKVEEDEIGTTGIIDDLGNTQML